MKKIKKENRKIILKLVPLLFLLSSLPVLAQPPHEFAVFAGLGFPKYHCQPPVKGGQSTTGFGGVIGGSFTGFTNDNIGFHIGAGLSLYRVEATVDKIDIYTPDLIDANGRRYNLSTDLKNYTESHRTLLLTIPLMAQFQTGQGMTWSRNSNMNHAFYMLAGLKLNVLLNSDYEITVDSLINKAYYPELDNKAETQRFAGFGHFKGKSANWNFDFAVLTTFALEAGGKWQIADNLYLYTGLFFDYGLNDPTKKNRKPTTDYIDPSLENFQLLKFSNRIHPLIFGLKVRLAFTKGGKSMMACPAFGR
jgi:hypothetical protein